MESNFSFKAQGDNFLLYQGAFLEPRIKTNSYLFLQTVAPKAWKYAINGMFFVTYGTNQSAVGFINEQTFEEGYIRLCCSDEHPNPERYAPRKILTKDITGISQITGSFQTHL